MVFPWFSMITGAVSTMASNSLAESSSMFQPQVRRLGRTHGGALEIDVRQIQLAMLVKSLSNPCRIHGKTLVPNPIPGHKKPFSSTWTSLIQPQQLSARDFDLGLGPDEIPQPSGAAPGANDRNGQGLRIS